MDYEMILRDNSIARNISIDSMNNFKCIKNTFKNNINNRTEIVEQFEPIIYRSLSDNKELHDLCIMSVDNGFRVLVVENIIILPFIFKYKGSEVKPIYRYVNRHVTSSIIKTVLLDGSGTLKQKCDRAVYLLYYYWFFSMDTIESITHNVCINIEDIISILINKGLTLYKTYTSTGELVELLREKLMSERLGNLKV